MSQGTTYRHKNKPNTSGSINQTFLFPFARDVGRMLGHLWFGSGTVVKEKFDELRVVESSSAPAALGGRVDKVEVLLNGSLVSKIENTSFLLVSDNLVPNDELYGRDEDRAQASSTLTRIGNVTLQNCPAFVCYWHGWARAKWLLWRG